MSAQERFDAASVELGGKITALLDKVRAFNALDDAHAQLSQAQAQIAQLEADKTALQNSCDEQLNRVSEWAENMSAQIAQLLP